MNIKHVILGLFVIVGSVQSCKDKTSSTSLVGDAVTGLPNQANDYFKFNKRLSTEQKTELKDLISGNSFISVSTEFYDMKKAPALKINDHDLVKFRAVLYRVM